MHGGLLDNDHLPGGDVDALDVRGKREGIVQADPLRLLRRGRVVRQQFLEDAPSVPGMPDTSADCTSKRPMPSRVRSVPVTVTGTRPNK